MLLRSQTAVMDQKTGETDEAYQARMLACSTETKKRADDAAAAAKKRAEDAEQARLLAMQQQRQHDEAAARAADEERTQRREKIITGERALLTMAAKWRSEAENSQLEDSANKIALLLSHLTDLLATCITQQAEILGLDNSVANLQDRLQRVEQRPVVVADAGSSNTTDHLTALEMHVGSLQDGAQLQQTATQQLQQRICTTATTSSPEPRETAPKFDGQEIFHDSIKTDPIPWFRKFEITLQLHNVKENKHHAYLYSRSGGAWLDLLSKYGVVAADLHTMISWDDLKAAWHKRFQVEPPEIKAMDKLMVFEQGSLPSTDWIAEYQRLTYIEDEAGVMVPQCRAEVLAQPDDKAKWDKVLGYLEVLSKAWMEERQASWSQDVALSAMRSGFRDFARAIVTHIGGEVKQLRDNVGKFCEGAIQGAKAAAAVEGEGRPRKDPVKLKFPDAYGGKKNENFDNWEASVNSYIYLQHILMEEQVLVAFQALKDEAASFARSLARTAGCENNLVAYFKVTPLSQFLKLLKERFADPTRGIRASDKLQTIHSRQWRSAKALKGTMDDLVAVPDHGVADLQLVQLFYRAIPEALRGHFFDKSQQPGMTYDALSREVILYELKSMPVTTFWHKDLEKGKKWKNRTISGQVKAKDHMILTLEEGGTDEVPYDQIEWGLEDDGNSVGQGRSYAAITARGRPQGLANYYRKFVRNFSTIAAPLRRLLKKETIWQWDKDCTSALKKLKRALIEYPVLKVADPSLPFVVTTDTSQYGIGAVLQQDDDNGYRPVEFMSARMPCEKVATSTYERELYALRQALDHWKHYLLGRHFKVYSDHETLRWLKTRAKMTPKLTRWAAEIDQFDFELKPVKGKYNVVADALSRRSDYFGAVVHYLDIERDLQEKVKQAYTQDPIYSDFLKRVREALETEPDYRTTDGLLFEKTNVFDRLCVPNSEEIRSLILGNVTILRDTSVGKRR
uniref:Reverse transcriptase RNase H-like domain-containing protein n=1 Tax=Chara braunii TaxID=69332 RepID=A0A388KR68_CHABU